MEAALQRWTTTPDPDLLEVFENIKEEEKLNVDEYTKFKKPPTVLQSFYAGKSIFLTGATGFMGKCFVEKVLRDCPDMKKLYVMVRPNGGVTPQEKMKKYFKNVIFDRLRKIDPNFEDKVVTINGDLYEKDLGLSAEDRQLLIDNVDIVVHNGATVRFNESISVTLRTNVLGTRDMLELAMACKHVQAFMYVSTAYSHCYKTQIKEEFYESPVDLKAVNDIIAADEAAKYGMSDEVVKMFLGKWANTYTFAKSISEDLVRQYGERANFACGVHRPSMVFASVKEPRIGWVGNKSGPIAGLIASALGFCHGVFYEDGPTDLIPVDYTINSLIAAIYHMTKEWEREKKPRVYNIGSSVANPLSFLNYKKNFVKYAPNIGSKYSVWVPSTLFVRSKLLFYIIHFFLHFIPAVFADTVLLLMRQKPRALSIFWTVTQNLNWILHFISYGWRIHVTEMRKVYEYLTEEDRRLFDFDIWRLSWKKFCASSTVGIRIYALNEPFVDQENATRRFFRLKILHYVTLTIFYLALLYYALRFYKYVTNLF